MNAMKTRGSHEKRDETTIDRIRSTDRFALNDRELSMGKGRLDSQNILYIVVAGLVQGGETPQVAASQSSELLLQHIVAELTERTEKNIDATW